jgi:hypothetical protein
MGLAADVLEAFEARKVRLQSTAYIGSISADCWFKWGGRTVMSRVIFVSTISLGTKDSGSPRA